MKDLAGNSVTMSEEMIQSLSNPGKINLSVTEWEKILKQDAKDMEAITEEGMVITAVERLLKSKFLVELVNRF